jgi:hypothetical protein
MWGNNWQLVCDGHVLGKVGQAGPAAESQSGTSFPNRDRVE